MAGQPPGGSSDPSLCVTIPRSTSSSSCCTQVAPPEWSLVSRGKSSTHMSMPGASSTTSQAASLHPDVQHRQQSHAQSTTSTKTNKGGDDTHRVYSVPTHATASSHSRVYLHDFIRIAIHRKADGSIGRFGRLRLVDVAHMVLSAIESDGSRVAAVKSQVASFLDESFPDPEEDDLH